MKFTQVQSRNKITTIHSSYKKNDAASGHICCVDAALLVLIGLVVLSHNKFLYSLIALLHDIETAAGIGHAHTKHVVILYRCILVNTNLID